jgi:uncharacterized iron-regulated membrane protein
MSRARRHKLWPAILALLGTLSAQRLSEHASGALAVVLYALACTALLAGIVLIFRWANEQDRQSGVQPTKYWFTPWRRT